MILRGLFWIAVVGVLMPHEPDLGLGRPNAAGVASLPSQAAEWLGSAAVSPQAACAEHAESCAAALNILDTLQTGAVRSLAQVKAQIEESQRERAARAFRG